MKYSKINSLLNQIYSGGTDDFVSNASAQINRQTDRNVEDTLSRFSTTGLGRSGIGGAAVNDIYAGSADALTNVAAQGSQMDVQNKLAAINGMLQVKQLQDQPSAWGQILGQLIGGGAQVGSSAMLANALKAAPAAPAVIASDKKLKKDIKYTGGKTKSGIPVANYKYKGDNKTHKGFIAQDVEKKFPQAVYKVIDLLKIPESEYEVVNG